MPAHFANRSSLPLLSGAQLEVKDLSLSCPVAHSRPPPGLAEPIFIGFSGVGINSLQIASVKPPPGLSMLGLPEVASPLKVCHDPKLSCDSTAFGSCTDSSSIYSETNEETEPQTTVMMRNLPVKVTRTCLLNLLDGEGFEGSYDFVYCPIDFYSELGLGYAFVSFTSLEDADRFRGHFQGFTRWGMTSNKVCDVTASGTEHGLAALVEKYRDSPVMHERVPDEFKPVIFTNGDRVAFPPPTKDLKLPRLSKKRRAAGVQQ